MYLTLITFFGQNKICDFDNIGDCRLWYKLSKKAIGMKYIINMYSIVQKSLAHEKNFLYVKQRLFKKE